MVTTFSPVKVRVYGMSSSDLHTLEIQARLRKKRSGQFQVLTSIIAVITARNAHEFRSLTRYSHRFEVVTHSIQKEPVRAKAFSEVQCVPDSILRQ